MQTETNQVVCQGTLHDVFETAIVMLAHFRLLSESLWKSLDHLGQNPRLSLCLSSRLFLLCKALGVLLIFSIILGRHAWTRDLGRFHFECPLFTNLVAGSFQVKIKCLEESR